VNALIQGDTVSEGIAYGMILAVYANDQKTFDGLYTYAKYYFKVIGGITLNCMHWQIS